MIANRTSAAALAACITLTLAACGGSGEPASPTFSTFQSAAVVLGQPDFKAGEGALDSPSQSTFFKPLGVAVSAAGILYVADRAYSRIVGFSDGVPARDGAPASFVLGQESFQAKEHLVTNTSHPRVSTVRITAGKMVATHHLTSRVVVFNSPPTGHGVQPDHLLGQSDFESEVSGCGPQNFHRPEDALITSDGRLIVADTQNHRILVWATLSSPSPSLVIGQDSFTRCAANDDDQNGSADAAPTARTLNYPHRIWTDGSRLAVSDAYNERVLIWNSFPTSNFQPADIVLGQATFTARAANDDNQDGSSDPRPSARTFSLPADVAVDGNRLAISDAGNNRVLIWERFPQVSFTPADVVLGQAGFDMGAYNDLDQNGVPDPAPSDKTLRLPTALAFYRGDLLVADSDNHRVLVFKAER